MLRKMGLALLVVVGVTGTIAAAEHKPGSFGLGWYSFDAPIGGRVWVTPRLGVDVGLGFFRATETDAKTHATVELGVPIDLVQTEKVNLFMRPGMSFWTNGKTEGTYPNLEYSTRKSVQADLGVEWFVTDRLSLGAGYGVRWTESTTEGGASVFRTQASGFSNVGFHFYF